MFNLSKELFSHIFILNLFLSITPGLHACLSRVLLREVRKQSEMGVSAHVSLREKQWCWCCGSPSSMYTDHWGIGGAGNSSAWCTGRCFPYRVDRKAWLSPGQGKIWSGSESVLKVWRDWERGLLWETEAALYNEGFPLQQSLMKETVLVCPNCYIQDGCKCICLTQGEPGVKYLSRKGILKKRSSLAKCSQLIWIPH